MAYDHYPTDQEVQAFFEGAGLTVSSALSDYLEGAAEAGKLEFERRTGRKPFLAEAESSREFDPPTRSRELVLPTDLASLTSITYQPTGSTATTLVAGTDFTTYPLNYAADSVPISRIRFSTRRWLDPLSIGFRSSLTITGQWGYATLIPADAWLAMLGLAALPLSPSIGQALRDGLIEWKEKDRGEKYEAGISSLSSMWSSHSDRVIARYRKISI